MPREHRSSDDPNRYRVRRVPERNVAWTELLAVVELVRELEHALGPRVHLRLATDSRVVQAVLEKGYSASADLDGLLEELREIQERTGITIQAIWLPSARNVADTPSRRVLNRRCHRCEGWRRPDLASDVVSRCARPIRDESEELLCTQIDAERRQMTLEVLR